MINSFQDTSVRNAVTQLGRLREGLRRTGTSVVALAIPALLAGLASLLEGASLALLIPTLNGILTRDVSFVLNLPVLRELAQLCGLHDGRDPLLIVVVVFATFAAAIGKTALQYISSVLTTRQIKHFANRLRTLLFERLLSFGKLFFDRGSSGQIQQLLTTYVTYISHTLSTLQGGIYSLSTLLVYLIILCAVSWKMTLVVFTLFPILYLSLRRLIARVGRSSRSFADSYNDLGKQIGNSLSSIPLVKAYCNEAAEKQAFSVLSTRVAETEFQIERQALLVSPIQEAILLVFLLGVVSVVSVFLISTPDVALAQYAVYLLVLKRAAALFGAVNTMRTALAGISGPLEEILQLFGEQGTFAVPEGPDTFAGLKQNIELCALSFTYPDGVQALTNVSFEIRRGAVTAIVGASGSGKSTLINLLLRFYDCLPGAVLVDGVDFRSFTHRSWRSRIALVSQDTFLFHATLRDNLCYGLHRSISDQELVQALTRARLLDYVRSLPAGLDTLVGDRGVKLSGGERQRVAIARAILKDAEILVLDEATSALDSVTERLIQEALDELTRDRTTVVVAHRLSTIQHADKIVVLEHGTVVEQGTLKGLLDSKGSFAIYWEQQQNRTV